MNRNLGGSASRGVALIAVLWLVALLTVLATSTVLISRSRVRIAKSAMESVQSTLMLDSAIRLTLAELASRGSTAEDALGRASANVFDETVGLRVDLERHRTNLNTATAVELARTFVSNGWPELRARLVAERVTEWRSTTAGPQSDTSNPAAGSRYEPRRAPLEAIDELAQVRDAGRLTSEMRESLTVYADSGSATSAEGASANAQAAATFDVEAIRGGALVRIQACVASSSDTCRRAVVRFTGNHLEPMQVFAWY